MDRMDVNKAEATAQDEARDEKFLAQLQKLVVTPFAERLHQELTNLFGELNFDDSFIKAIKEAKKTKRQNRRQLSHSASKTTPTKGCYDFSKSPNAVKKRKQVQ